MFMLRDCFPGLFWTVTVDKLGGKTRSKCFDFVHGWCLMYWQAECLYGWGLEFDFEYPICGLFCFNHCEGKFCGLDSHDCQVGS